MVHVATVFVEQVPRLPTVEIVDPPVSIGMCLPLRGRKYPLGQGEGLVAGSGQYIEFLLAGQWRYKKYIYGM